MLHIYCGDGKGKTTAAFGLALRAAGRARRVIVAQFLKSEDTGERRSMEYVPHVLLLPLPERVKFVAQMDVIERAECEAFCAGLLRDVAILADKTDVILLDEVFAALEKDILPLDSVLELLEGLPEDCEVVMTGRNPPRALMDRADYITEMAAVRHPYRSGVPAREGIEY